jgi:hypothetical protein
VSTSPRMGGLRPEVMPEKAAMESGAATGQTTGRDGTPPAAAFRAVRTVTSEADAPVGDLPGHYRRLAPDIPLPGGGAAHSPLAWPITGNLLADSDDPRGLREDLRPHVLPTAVGFLIALAVHLTE